MVKKIETNEKMTALTTQTALISILKEMGTDLDPYKMADWEVHDEIIRRICLQKDAFKRLKSDNKKLTKQIDVMAQTSIYDLIKRRNDD